MIHSKHDMHSWKKEQISYFQRYLDSFEKGTEQYNVLRKGISELEKSEIL
ncbi:MAG: hypothetical protein PF637_09860 [Spirochaetes bacterium]|jgi:hypothetical protein|nr:hypothetical protein [Spirochaetota bacterium]